MSEELKTPEAQVEVEKTAQETAQEAPKNVLFGTIGYNDDASYENFIQNMNLGQALFALIASANYSQAKGSFNLLESEVLSTAIRIIRKNSTSEPANNGEPAKA
jgi:hypothetical protein